MRLTAENIKLKKRLNVLESQESAPKTWNMMIDEIIYLRERRQSFNIPALEQLLHDQRDLTNEEYRILDDFVNKEIFEK